MLAELRLFWLLLPVLAGSLKVALAHTQGLPHAHPYGIRLDLNSSHTYMPTKSPTLYLGSLNLSFPMVEHEHSFVKIGLKYPSDFLVAVSQYFHVKESEIEVGFHPLAELIVSEVNFVEERHAFANGALYEFAIAYNYGRGLKIGHQVCELVEGDRVYFNEYMILEVLNSMTADNGIRWNKTDSTKILLQGNLYNFPHIALVRGEMQIQLDVLHDAATLYLNNETTSNRIGLQALKGYSKLQVQESGFVLKGSAFNIVLYIFLGLFVAFSLALTINCRNETAYTINFIRTIFKSVFLKDRRARVDILTTELE